jgi:hypothetical protein
MFTNTILLAGIASASIRTAYIQIQPDSLGNSTVKGEIKGEQQGEDQPIIYFANLYGYTTFI